jgi:hypothetical protein
MISLVYYFSIGKVNYDLESMRVSRHSTPSCFISYSLRVQTFSSSGIFLFRLCSSTAILTRYLVDHVLLFFYWWFCFADGNWRSRVVYQIPCQDCMRWSYIGETGRSLKTRKSEHVRNVKQSKN